MAYPKTYCLYRGLFGGSKNVTIGVSLCRKCWRDSLHSRSDWRTRQRLMLTWQHR